jgi:hypothetical protein
MQKIKNIINFEIQKNDVFKSEISMQVKVIWFD